MRHNARLHFPPSGPESHSHRRSAETSTPDPAPPALNGDCISWLSHTNRAPKVVLV
ncbi:hypothetical protein LZ30DRAFT_722964 [Colletotrichum cereale]|nr:hypothetical protein LZ30DRAFT_722964 [Colletotrichum cereale]